MDTENAESRREPEASDVLSFSLAATGIDGPLPAPVGALGLEEVAVLTGSHRWTERRLFEMLGTWVADEGSELARVLFDLHSQQHAWHSELFGERLPVLDWIDADALTSAPSASSERALELAGAADTTLLRLVGTGRFLLPRLVAGYTLHLERATSVADAPLRRVLRLVLRDEIEAWQASELMLEGLVRDHDDAAVAAGHLQALEGALSGSGPGLFSWPSRAQRECGA